MTSKAILEKYPITILALFTFTILFPYFSFWPVSIMEARNFITAREMLLDDNWLLTTINGIPRYQKPPFPTWMSAIFASMIDTNNTFAMRIPTAIMLFFVGVLSHKFTIRFLNKENAIINALITITSFYLIAITVEAPWDIYTHGFMLASIYFLYSCFKGYKLKYIIYATIFWALSVLSKGPIGMFALFLPFILAYFITYKFSSKRLYQTLIVLALGSAIGAIWYFYVRMVDPESFNQIASKETGNWSSYNVRPFYYYWSFFVQSGMWALPAFAALLYPYIKSKVADKKSYLFTLLWTLFSVVLLSFIPEKKSRYLVPVLIPMALNTGFYIRYLINNFKTKVSLFDKIVVYIHFGLLGLVALSAPILGIILYKKHPGVNLAVVGVAVVSVTYIGIKILSALRHKEIKEMFNQSILFFGSLLLFLPIILSGTNKQKEFDKQVQAIRNFKHEVKLPFFSMDYISPEFLWYSETIIPQLQINGLDRSKGEVLTDYNDDNLEFILPNLEKFGLLVDLEKRMHIEKWSKMYHIEKQKQFDINLPTAHKKRHRYITSYFIFTKK